MARTKKKVQDQQRIELARYLATQSGRGRGQRGRPRGRGRGSRGTRPTPSFSTSQLTVNPGEANPSLPNMVSGKNLPFIKPSLSGTNCVTQQPFQESDSTRTESSPSFAFKTTPQKTPTIDIDSQPQSQRKATARKSTTMTKMKICAHNISKTEAKDVGNIFDKMFFGTKESSEKNLIHKNQVTDFSAVKQPIHVYNNINEAIQRLGKGRNVMPIVCLRDVLDGNKKKASTSKIKEETTSGKKFKCAVNDTSTSIFVPHIKKEASSTALSVPDSPGKRKRSPNVRLGSDMILLPWHTTRKPREKPSHTISSSENIDSIATDCDSKPVNKSVLPVNKCDKSSDLKDQTNEQNSGESRNTQQCIAKRKVDFTISANTTCDIKESPVDPKPQVFDITESMQTLSENCSDNEGIRLGDEKASSRLSSLISKMSARVESVPSAPDLFVPESDSEEEVTPYLTPESLPEKAGKLKESTECISETKIKEENSANISGKKNSCIDFSEPEDKSCKSGLKIESYCAVKSDTSVNIDFQHNSVPQVGEATSLPSPMGNSETSGMCDIINKEPSYNSDIMEIKSETNIVNPSASSAHKGSTIESPGGVSRLDSPQSVCGVSSPNFPEYTVPSFGEGVEQSISENMTSCLKEELTSSFEEDKSFSKKMSFGLSTQITPSTNENTTVSVAPIANTCLLPIVKTYSTHNIIKEGLGEDSSASKMEDSSPSKMKDSSASKMEDSSASKMEDSSASKMEDSSPSKMKDSSANKMEDSSASKMEDSSASKMEDSSASKMEDLSASKMEDLSASKMEDSSASKMEDSSPSKMKDSSASKMEDSSASKMEDSSASKMENSSASKLGNLLTSIKEDSSASKKNDSSPIVVLNNTSFIVKEDVSPSVIESSEGTDMLPSLICDVPPDDDLLYGQRTREPAPLSVLSKVECQTSPKSLSAFTSDNLDSYLQSVKNRKVVLSSAISQSSRQCNVPLEDTSLNTHTSSYTSQVRPVKHPYTSSTVHTPINAKEMIQSSLTTPQQTPPKEQIESVGEKSNSPINPDFDDVDGMLFVSFHCKDTMNAHINIEHQNYWDDNNFHFLDICKFHTAAKIKKELGISGKLPKDFRDNRDKEVSFRGIHMKWFKYLRLFKREMQKLQSAEKTIFKRSDTAVEDINNWSQNAVEKEGSEVQNEALPLQQTGKLHWRTEQRLLKSLAPSDIKQMGLELKKKRRKNMIFTHRKGSSSKFEGGHVGRFGRLQKSRFDQDNEYYYGDEAKYYEDDHDVRQKESPEKTPAIVNSVIPKKISLRKQLKKKYNLCGLKKLRKMWKLRVREGRRRLIQDRDKRRNSGEFPVLTETMALHALTALEFGGCRLIPMGDESRGGEDVVLVGGEEVNKLGDEEEQTLCDKPGCRYGCVCHLFSDRSVAAGKSSDSDEVQREVSAKKCEKEYCRLGCICSSLERQQAGKDRHCGKPDCMFGCRCEDLPADDLPTNDLPPNDISQNSCSSDDLPQLQPVSETSLSPVSSDSPKDSVVASQVKTKPCINKKFPNLPLRVGSQRVAKNLDAITRKALMYMDPEDIFPKPKRRRVRKCDQVPVINRMVPSGALYSKMESFEGLIPDDDDDIEVDYVINTCARTTPISFSNLSRLSDQTVPRPSQGEDQAISVLSTTATSPVPAVKDATLKVRCDDVPLISITDEDTDSTPQISAISYHTDSQTKDTTVNLKQKQRKRKQRIEKTLSDTESTPVKLKPVDNTVKRPVSPPPVATNVITTVTDYWSKNMVCLKSDNKLQDHPHLLEIMSNCNWETGRRRILSKISRSLVSSNYPSPMDFIIDEFTISFLPKASKPAKIPPNLQASFPSVMFPIRVTVSPTWFNKKEKSAAGRTTNHVQISESGEMTASKQLRLSKDLKEETSIIVIGEKGAASNTETVNTSSWPQSSGISGLNNLFINKSNPTFAIQNNFKENISTFRLQQGQVLFNTSSKHKTNLAAEKNSVSAPNSMTTTSTFPDKKQSPQDNALGTTQLSQEKPLGTTQLSKDKSLGTTQLSQENPLGTTQLSQEKPLGTTLLYQDKSLGTTQLSQEKPLGTTQLYQDKSLGTTQLSQDKSLGTTQLSQDKPLWTTQLSQDRVNQDKELPMLLSTTLPLGSKGQSAVKLASSPVTLTSGLVSPSPSTRLNQTVASTMTVTPSMPKMRIIQNADGLTKLMAVSSAPVLTLYPFQQLPVSQAQPVGASSSVGVVQAGKTVPGIASATPLPVISTGNDDLLSFPIIYRQTPGQTSITATPLLFAGQPAPALIPSPAVPGRTFVIHPAQPPVTRCMVSPVTNTPNCQAMLAGSSPVVLQSSAALSQVNAAPLHTKTVRTEHSETVLPRIVKVKEVTTGIPFICDNKISDRTTSPLQGKGDINNDPKQIESSIPGSSHIPLSNNQQTKLENTATSSSELAVNDKGAILFPNKQDTAVKNLTFTYSPIDDSKRTEVLTDNPVVTSLPIQESKGKEAATGNLVVTPLPNIESKQKEAATGNLVETPLPDKESKRKEAVTGNLVVTPLPSENGNREEAVTGKAKKGTIKLGNRGPESFVIPESEEIESEKLPTLSSEVELVEPVISLVLPPVLEKTKTGNPEPNSVLTVKERMRTPDINESKTTHSNTLKLSKMIEDKHSEKRSPLLMKELGKYVLNRIGGNEASDVESSLGSWSDISGETSSQIDQCVVIDSTSEEEPASQTEEYVDVERLSDAEPQRHRSKRKSIVPRSNSPFMEMTFTEETVIVKPPGMSFTPENTYPNKVVRKLHTHRERQRRTKLVNYFHDLKMIVIGRSDPIAKIHILVKAIQTINSLHSQATSMEQTLEKERIRQKYLQSKICALSGELAEAGSTSTDDREVKERKRKKKHPREHSKKKMVEALTLEDGTSIQILMSDDGFSSSAGMSSKEKSHNTQKKDTVLVDNPIKLNEPVNIRDTIVLTNENRVDYPDSMKVTDDVSCAIIEKHDQCDEPIDRTHFDQPSEVDSNSVLPVLSQTSVSHDPGTVRDTQQVHLGLHKDGTLVAEGESGQAEAKLDKSVSHSTLSETVPSVLVCDDGSSILESKALDSFMQSDKIEPLLNNVLPVDTSVQFDDRSSVDTSVQFDDRSSVDTSVQFDDGSSGIMEIKPGGSIIFESGDTNLIISGVCSLSDLSAG